jgi:hypothetical protein
VTSDSHIGRLEVSIRRPRAQFLHVRARSEGKGKWPCDWRSASQARGTTTTPSPLMNTLNSIREARHFPPLVCI